MTDAADDAHQPVDGHQILEKLVALPISTWNYKTDPPSVRHLGPMAQDFAAAFGLGDSDRTIHTIDANGVVMVSIQALYRRLQALEAEVGATDHATADLIKDRRAGRAP